MQKSHLIREYPDGNRQLNITYVEGGRKCFRLDP